MCHIEVKNVEERANKNLPFIFTTAPPEDHNLKILLLVVGMGETVKAEVLPCLLTIPGNQ